MNVNSSAMENVKLLMFIGGILCLIVGTLFIATFKGLILLNAAVFMVAVGLVLPYLSFLLPEKAGSLIESKRNLVVYGLLALATQLILAQVFYDVFNFGNWLRFFGFFERGINGYSYCFSNKIFDMFPYPPTFLAFLAFGKGFTMFFGESFFPLFFKLPLILSNILCGYIIYRLLLFLRNDQKFSEKMFFLYIFNPLLITVTSIQGEFDSFIVLLTVLATFSLIVKKSVWLGGLCLGAAISMKLYPVFLLPFFLIYLKKLEQRVLFVVLSALPLSLVSIPFLVLDYEAYIGVVLNSGATVGPISLFSILFNFRPMSSVQPLIVTMAPTYALIALLFLFRFRKSKDELVTNILLCTLALYIFNPIMHENHGVWMLPFVYLKFAQIKHLHWASFPLLMNMLVFLGIPTNGFGLFYWVNHITQKNTSVFQQLSVPDYWSLSGLLVIIFVLICGYVLIKFGFMAAKTNYVK